MAEEKTVDASTDNLDDFEALWDGKVTETQKVEENVEDNVEEPEDLEEVEDIDADDDIADDSSATEEELETPEEKPKGKKTAQDRIDELTKARREAEREADKWKAIAEERERSQGKKEEPEAKETTPETKAEVPNPSDKDKYPLGDLDPQYQADMLDYKLEQRISQLNSERETQEKQRAEQARAAGLQAEWEGKLEAAQESYGDFRETVQSLESAFAGVDPQHGQFIAETVMGMEKGTDVLYHLAKNPETVRALIDSSPVNAALALGRLEATFATDEAPKAMVRKTKAPTPPASVNKGNAPRLSVKPDTDDLDAFEDVFFNKK